MERDELEEMERRHRDCFCYCVTTKRNGTESASTKGRQIVEDGDDL